MNAFLPEYVNSFGGIEGLEAALCTNRVQGISDDPAQLDARAEHFGVVRARVPSPPNALRVFNIIERSSEQD